LQRPQARNPADAGPQRKLWVAGTLWRPDASGRLPSARNVPVSASYAWPALAS